MSQPPSIYSTEQTVGKTMLVDGSFVYLADGVDQTRHDGIDEVDENDFRSQQ